MKKITGTNTSFTCDPANIIAYSRQGAFILITLTGNAQHNVSCGTIQEAINLEVYLDGIMPTPPVKVPAPDAAKA